MRRIALRLRGLFLFSILLSLLIIALYGNASGQEQWRLAREIAPPELLAQILQENVQSGKVLDVEQMKVWKPEKPQSLYLIDTQVANAAKQPRDNPLCGQQQCLFLGYVPRRDRYQRILSIYLNPHLPPKLSLWQTLSEIQNGLPCLMTHQLVQQKLQASKLCFNHTAYEILETQLLPNRYE